MKSIFRVLILGMMFFHFQAMAAPFTMVYEISNFNLAYLTTQDHLRIVNTPNPLYLTLKGDSESRLYNGRFQVDLSISHEDLGLVDMPLYQPGILSFSANGHSLSLGESSNLFLSYGASNRPEFAADFFWNDYPSLASLNYLITSMPEEMEGRGSIRVLRFKGNAGRVSFSNIGFFDGRAIIINATLVPEPTTYAMLGLGLGLLGVAARRRKSA